MSDLDLRSDMDAGAEDKAEIERSAGRANSISRRGFVAASSGILPFVIPAIATFTISPEALGSTGSGRGPDGSHNHRGGNRGGNRWGRG